MQKDSRIGLVQMEAIVGDVDHNLTQIAAFIKKASDLKVDILCFPECSLQGYAPNIANDLALPLENIALEHCVNWSRNYNITLLIGLFEKGKSCKPYISQAIITPDETINVYRKVHLGRSESPFIEAGKEFPVFLSHGVKFAVGICWDWHFPEMAAIYSLKGAEILFAPHASPVVSGDRREIWLRYLQARAYDNSVYLGACNLTGTNGQDKEFSGGTLIFGPKGDIINESFVREGTLLTAHLSADRINTIRTWERSTMKESFFLADRRKELYRELVEIELDLKS